MFKKILLATVILALLLAGCASAKSAYDGGAVTDSYAPSLAPAAEQEYYEYDTASSIPQEPGFVSNTAVGEITVERMVIKNANLSLAVDDPTVSMENISKLAEEMGGYVVSANMYQTYLESGVKVPYVSITIRVPAGKLNDALTRIKAETGQPVIREEITSQDVTAEYTDLASRLTNLEAAEDQLQAIMDEAVKTEDVLSVYNQLVSVREQIEVIKGQMQYYEQSAAMSAISVELQTNEAVQPLTIGGWQPAGVAKDAVQALINTLKGLADAAIWIVLYVLPVALVCLGPIVLIVWAILRWRAKRKKAKLAPPASA